MSEPNISAGRSFDIERNCNVTWLTVDDGESTRTITAKEPLTKALIASMLFGMHRMLTRADEAA